MYGFVLTLVTHQRLHCLECSVKSSEGFRLHKGVVRTIVSVPHVRECEKMCATETSFKCHTYSFRYTPVGRDNCLLCDRPYHHLDIYADLEPDRDFDIYSMSDDPKVCKQEINRNDQHQPQPQQQGPKDSNAQCFFRSIEASRFYPAVVRDSMNVKSVGECELQCLRSEKFTCRAFTFRYGQQAIGSVPENCQLSDWPVRDMDKTRHLVPDPSFDVYERASYGHGCEIKQMIDDKHNKKCM